MSAMRVWVSAVLRRRWRATVVLSLLIGIGGAAALGAADGARRTQTAFPRMVKTTRAGDVLLSVAESGLLGYYDAVGKLPEVSEVAPVAGVPLAALDARGQPDPNITAGTIAATDDRFGFAMQRMNILAGRMYNASAVDEVVASERAAEDLHLRVGSRLPLFVAKNSDYASGSTETFRVVGIGVIPEEVVPTTSLDAQPRVLFTPAFFHKEHFTGNALNFDGAYVRLRPGTRLSDFERDANRLAAAHPETGGQIFVQDETLTAAREQRSILPLAIALYVFAGLVALSGVLVIGQAISRQQFVEAEDYHVLRALGYSRRQLVAVGLVRVGVIAAVGAILGALLALAVSPFMPIGAARLAETSRGFDPNLAILGLGALAISLVIVARAAIPAWRVAREAARSPGRLQGRIRHSVLASAAARAGMSPEATSGVRMAFEQSSGSSSVPLRSALGGTVVGLAALIAALMFGSSLNRLVATPSEFGWTWSVMADGQFDVLPITNVVPKLEAQPYIAAFSAGNYGTVAIDGHDVPAVGIDMVKGTVYPTVLDGSPARTADQIVLGTKTMREFRTSIGKRILVSLNGGTPRAMLVVGRAVFPELGRGSFAPTALGEGAAVVAGDLPPAFNPDTSGSYNFLLVRFRSGVDAATAAKRLTATVNFAPCQQVGNCSVEDPQRPSDINVLAQVRSAPVVLAGLLALLAVATLTHALLASVRTRARDLAILKTVGFVRRQIRATVAWQTSTLALAALVVGLPLGVVAGRAAWALFANGVGVPATAVVPLLAVLFAIPATLLVANGVGAL
ncbi:MAG TPA: FtsX-like permease family protein, partial [Actinomycetota bacterium]|nr:FtsX-like permease family protein [Actinomycetota bacterium]